MAGPDPIKGLEEYLIEAATAQSEATRTANIAKIKQMGLPFHLKEGARSYSQARLEESLKLTKASEGGEGGKQPQQADPGKSLQIEPVSGDPGGTGIDVVGAITGLAEKAGLNLGGNQTGASGATNQGAPVDRRGQAATQNVTPPSTDYMSLGHPLANIMGRLTGLSKIEKPSRTNTTWSKDNQSIGDASTGIAAEMDSLDRGFGKPEDLQKATKAAMAELGPAYGAEAIAEAKSIFSSLKRTRIIGEIKARKEYEMGLVGQGAPPEVVGRLGKAYSEGPETLAREVQSIGWKPKATDAEFYAAELAREKLGKIRRENRIGDRDDARDEHTRNMRIDREGLSWGVGYRLSEEEAGWTKPEVNSHLTKVLAGGVDSKVAGTLPGLQKAKLALDDEMVFAKNGNVITGDSSYSLKGKDVILAFAEAGGRRPRKAPATAGEKERGYGGEASDPNDVDPGATLKFRRDRAQWLTDNIVGLDGYDEIPMGDGVVGFGWREEQGNRNTPFIMHIQDIAKKHAEIEESEGRQLNDYTFGNKAMILEARGGRGEEPTTPTADERIPEVTLSPGVKMRNIVKEKAAERVRKAWEFRGLGRR